ncbi:GL20545 [Drosophila persimilis]|uniref:GL20545 n=1 Tax=Drosophila persimilis TaxID=7234 RepID=B4G6V8_DROPE|nr:GL20545 [Drosophila persimilis]
MAPRQTFPQIPNGVHCGLEIRARRMHGYAHGGIPALQQGDEVVEERVVRVGGVCDRFVALDFAVLRPHVVLQDPEVAALQRLLMVVAIVAIDQRSHSLLQLLLVAGDDVAIGLCVVELWIPAD